MVGSYFEPYPRWLEFEREHWIKQILEGPLSNQPGKIWAYSTANYGILGEIIARKSGMPYDEYIIKKIAKPLGMERTFFIVPDELIDEVSFGSPDEEAWIKRRNEEGIPLAYAPGGALLSTAVDLSIYGQMLLNKGTYKGVRILSRKSVEAMTKNWLSKDVKTYCWGAKGKTVEFGLGFDLNKGNTLAHDGFSHEGVGRCGMILDPNSQLAFIYFVAMYSDAWEWHANFVITSYSIHYTKLYEK